MGMFVVFSACQKDSTILNTSEIMTDVKIVATIHASSVEELKRKHSFQNILNYNLFERFVVLSNEFGVGTIDGVFDENLKFIGV